MKPLKYTGMDYAAYGVLAVYLGIAIAFRAAGL